MRLKTLLQSATAVIAIALATPSPVYAKDTTPVVATFSILGDLVREIGGKHIALTTLVGPDGDAHVYKPTPADARAVSGAKVLFVNGLDFEGWINRLVDASDFKGTRVVATEGIEAIPLGADDDHGAFDPHAWQSAENIVIYVDNITAALAKADPSSASKFFENRTKYVAKVKALDADISARMKALPEAARTVITSHDAFGYFAKRYGLNFEAPQGMSTESEASAKDVAALITQIRKEKIRAGFVETITDNRLMEQIVRETGAKIGGTLYSDALSGADGPAGTYLDMMRHNSSTILGVLTGT